MKGHGKKGSVKRKKTWRIFGLVACMSMSMVFGGCTEKDVVRVAVSEEQHVQIFAELFFQLAKEKLLICCSWARLTSQSAECQCSERKCFTLCRRE